MKLSQILGKDKITLSFEVFPPKTEANYEAVKKAALDVAALNPSYMSVPTVRAEAPERIQYRSHRQYSSSMGSLQFPILPASEQRKKTSTIHWIL